MLKKAQHWVGCISTGTPFEWSTCRSAFVRTIGLSILFWSVRMGDWIDMTECQAAQSLPSVKGIQR